MHPTSPAGPFWALIEAIVAGDSEKAIELLRTTPRLIKDRAGAGATRESPEQYFFASIRHYMYEGDTALHIAAAAHQVHVIEKLIALGADAHARNRRGATPLHYAADGGPGEAAAQRATVGLLVGAGADPNALDKSGVTPLHRAVRKRCAAAVMALIECGADPNAANKSGSTPLFLATRNTGAGGSGSLEAKAQQLEIVAFLKSRGAIE
jgi:ankyrin repeat protein